MDSYAPSCNWDDHAGVEKDGTIRMGCIRMFWTLLPQAVIKFHKFVVGAVEEGIYRTSTLQKSELEVLCTGTESRPLTNDKRQ